jgi:ABC-type branched-subunit amino acid transport system ATPase component
MALELANSAYVVERGRVTMQGKAHTLAEDENIVKSYLGG